MRVLVVSEGPSELNGALGVITKRLAPAQCEFSTDVFRNNSIRAYHGKGGGFFKRAIRWMLEAEKRGFEAVVIVIDQDGERNRSQQFDEAQLHQLSPIKRALGVAIYSFDAWMLADEKALTNAIGFAVKKQKLPEKNPDPKKICNTLRDQSQFQGLPEMYAAIAPQVDLGVVANRCPKGFAPFAARVKALASD